MIAMENIGKTMKILALIIKQKEPYQAEYVRTNALIIKQHARPSLTKLFPKDSLQKPTAAFANIWDKWDDFTELSNQLTLAASDLASTAENGDPQFKAKFKSLAKTCSSCHKTFRKKKH